MRASLKPAAAARKRSVSGCSGRSWVRSRMNTSRKPSAEAGFTVSSTSSPPGRSARWASASSAARTGGGRCSATCAAKTAPEAARCLASKELHEVALDDVEALARGTPAPRGRCLRRPAPRCPPRAAASRNSPRPQPRSTTGALPAQQLDVVGLSRADVLARAAEAVLEGGVGRVRRRPRRRARDLRAAGPAPGGPRAARAPPPRGPRGGRAARGARRAGPASRRDGGRRPRGPARPRWGPGPRACRRGRRSRARPAARSGPGPRTSRAGARGAAPRARGGRSGAGRGRR